MSTGAERFTPYIDEARIERTLTALVGRLDRTVNQLNILLGACVLMGGPVVYLFLWRGCACSWWVALLVAEAVFVGVVVGGMYALNRVVWRAVRRFSQRFPSGTPERAVALDVLGDLRSPGHVERNLLDLLEPPVGRVQRRRRGTPPSPGGRD